MSSNDNWFNIYISANEQSSQTDSNRNEEIMAFIHRFIVTEANERVNFTKTKIGLFISKIQEEIDDNKEILTDNSYVVLSNALKYCYQTEKSKAIRIMLDS